MKRSGYILSIVIPVYNRSGVVLRTLDSIAAQNSDAFRLILVDNGSTDRSFELCRDWAAVHCSHMDISLISESRKGAAVARNRGLAAVDTPWTMFFDSDDVMLPGHITRIIQVIGNDVQADLIGWDTRCIFPDGGTRMMPFEPGDLAWHNLMHGSLATQRYCARTDLFRKAGGWCEELSTWDDIELGTRMLCLNPKVYKISGKPLVDVYYSEESITGRSFSDTMEACMASLIQIKRNYGRIRPLSHVALKQVILSADCCLEGSDAYSLLKQAVAGEKMLSNKLVLRLAWFYRRIGLRGAARLFKYLLR